MRIMKKMIYASTLLAFVLALLIGGGVKTSAATLDLTDAQKLDYYKQYQLIVDEINGGNPNASLTLSSFEEFTDEDFIEISEFEEYAIERSNVIFNSIREVDNSKGGISPLSTVPGNTSTKVKSNGTEVTLTINGSFVTNYDTILKRQVFGGINSITVKPNKGSWVKSSPPYTYNVIDGGRTYQVLLSGSVKIGTITSHHNIDLEYYCNTDGSVTARVL